MCSPAGPRGATRGPRSPCRARRAALVVLDHDVGAGRQLLELPFDWWCSDGTSRPDERGGSPVDDTAGSPTCVLRKPGPRRLRPVSLRVPLRKPVRAQAAVGAASRVG